MFGTIRKHQTWLWAVIITLTIISFVIFFSPYSRMNQGRTGPANYGSINGERITPEEFADARREVYLRYFFMSGGSFPGDDSRKMGFDDTRETYFRLLLIRKQEEMGIHVSTQAGAETARNMVAPLQKAGINSAAAFVKQVLEPRQFTMDDFERFVRHELGIQELINAVGLSGKLVTPQEARGIYEREHEEIATEAAFFSATNYLANVPVTPEAVTNYYLNHTNSYTIPERMQVSYVEYVLTNYLDEAMQEMAKMTNLNDRIEAIYQQRGTNYYKEAKTPEEAKAKIREEARKEFMTAAAVKRAREFAGELFSKEPFQAQNLTTMAKEKNLTVKISTPFDRTEGPKELHVTSDFAKKAFMLTPTNDPFAGPLAGEDAVYIIAYNQRLASEVPGLDQVRTRVEADYKFDQAKLLARSAGQGFAATLTNALAQGKSFSNACAEASIAVTEVPAFSLSTRDLPLLEDKVNFNQLKQLGFSTAVGKASGFQPTVDGGLVLFVKAKLPFDTAKMNTELPGFVDALRQTRQNEAFQEWFRNQVGRGLRDTPIGQPRAPSTVSSGATKS